jgi:SAM-dependent methyltransferase
VTSDCKPWPKTLDTLICRRCGHLQKASDQDAVAEVNSVYLNYELYHLSSGGEQFIFQGDAEEPRTRSSLLLELLATRVNLGHRGKMLDIGCGNGATLSAFHRVRPQWTLAGFEQSESIRPRILGLPGVRQFWSGTLEAIPASFDLITVVHVLEHVSEPISFLRHVLSLLAPGGWLLIQVPNAAENPFDMLVTDHYSHFSPEILDRFVRSFGFEAIPGDLRWVAKEITLILKVGSPGMQDWLSGADLERSNERFDRNASWLRTVVGEVTQQAAGSRFGIFGTAIAGTWLGAAVGGRLAFFVDEDERRIGKQHLGRPILHPKQLTRGDKVFLAFPHEIARKLRERLASSSPATFLIPSPP